MSDLQVCASLAWRIIDSPSLRDSATGEDPTMTSQPDIDTQRIYYDERWSAEGYANRLQLRRAVAILDGLHRLDLREPSMLDLGCGTGWLAGILARFGPTTGIDLSPAAVERAKARYPDVRFLAADFSGPVGLDETFDVVVSQEVIEHVEDQRRYVELIAKFLRPGGYLILTTPNAWNLAHWTPDQIEAWGLQPIEQWLTARQLAALLAPRFEIVRTRTIIPGFGTRGTLRLVNSPKLTAALRTLGLTGLYETGLERGGFGLHTLVVARRRP